MQRTGLLLLALGFGFVVGACFDAPRPAVQFSCDMDTAPECPPDYTCQSDGCCHLDGSDVEAHAGECQLAGAIDSEGVPATDTSAGSESSGDSGATAGESEGSGTAAGSSEDSGSTAGSSGAMETTGDSGTTAGG
ncbi:MAG: hypothetical protein AAF799_15935 [Myxococcota bacterium]